jgi:hypothetical protein
MKTIDNAQYWPGAVWVAKRDGRRIEILGDAPGWGEGRRFLVQGLDSGRVRRLNISSLHGTYRPEEES